MTTVLIVLAMHSILFVILHARVSVYHQENRKVLNRSEALVEGVIADRKEEHRGFMAFFHDSIIPLLPEDALKTLTEEHRRSCIRYMLETPLYYNGVSFKNTDIGCVSENTYSIKNGGLFIDGVPAIEFIKTLPKIDHRQACSAAFAKWPEAYLRALAAQYFTVNNNA